MQQGHRTITIDARPEPVSIDTAQCAVLVIDMQNDFGAKGGMFDRAGIDIAIVERVVEPTARTLAAARDVAMPIIYLKMQHTADLANAGGAGSPHWTKHKPFSIGTLVTTPDGGVGRALVEGTWNTETLSALAPKEGDPVVAKHRYSGFFETRLDNILREKNIRYLIVTGCTTSVCVESTIRDAMFRDYCCVVLEDCVAEPIGIDLPRSNHAASLLTIELLFGWVSDSRKFAESLGGGPRRRDS
jgi:ureidoacrylate peracid hydrolase